MALYENYSVHEKKVLGILLEDEEEFLTELANQMDKLENANILYSSWSVTPLMMLFELFSAKGEFTEEHIRAIVTVISEIDLKKFEALRHFGWCSGYDLGGCQKEYIEFNWLNQSWNCTHKDNKKIKSLDRNICKCMICNYRFENE